VRASIQEAKERISIAYLWHQFGFDGEPRKQCRCPFHEDRTPSFSVFEDGKAWKCFAGCGEGSVIDFLAKAKGLSDQDACREIMRMAGSSPKVEPRKPNRKSGDTTDSTSQDRPLELPAPIPYSKEIAQRVAESRGLSIAGIDFAFYLETLTFGKVCGHDCWILSDASQKCAEARRIDRKLFPALGDLEERKPHTLHGSGKRWPIGLLPGVFEESWLREHVHKILLVEGGPDYLAACQIIYEQDVNVLPVAMLGASLRICNEALPYFTGRHVTIVGHPEEAGRAAATRWGTQIKAAGDRCGFLRSNPAILTTSLTRAQLSMNFSEVTSSNRWGEEIPIPETVAQKEQRELLELLNKRRFDPSNPPKKPEPIFRLAGQTISTPGNLLGIQSKAKGGKTALVGAFIGRAISDDDSGDYFGLEAKANPNGLAIVHFDTEQSRYDSFQVVDRALRRGDIKTAPPFLRSYSLADLDKKTRRKLLSAELSRANNEHGGIYMAILDGAADLILNVNDPEESNECIAEFHALAINYDCVIVCVLHENPGDNQHGKTRGHFGSELERKAESNLRLEKNGDEIITLWSERSRQASLPKERGITFKWDAVEMMHTSCEPSRNVKANAKVRKLQTLAEEIFNCQEAVGGMTWTQVHERIELLCEVKREGARRQFNELKESKIIKQNCADLWIRCA
jgi:hypothetical protein